MKTIIAAVASTFLLCAANAQPSAPPKTAAQASETSDAAMKKADAMRDQAVEKHIKDLHAKLQISAAEESQWGAVAQTMRDSAVELEKAIDKRAVTAGNASAIDDLNAYGAVAQAHADGVKKLSASFSPLYASMSDEQKKVADDVFAQRAHEGKKASKQ